ncbi:MAG TPA: hypothetical protein VGO30_24630 [Mycobacterium sp.]|jgi:hypothetical protein|nr:hypothetical protein [Mycobacterium sp.]
MPSTRRFAALLTVLGTAVVLSGCSTSTTEPERSTAASASTPTASSSSAAPGGYDLSRLAELRVDIPIEFEPKVYPKERLDGAFASDVGAVVSSGEHFAVDPPQCRPLLKPVDATAGVESVTIRADKLKGKDGIWLGAYSPVSVPSGIPSTGCDRMMYSVPELQNQTGTVARIPAPDIEGATTIALQIQVNQYQYVGYHYAAIIGDDAFIRVEGRFDPSFQAQPMLPDMLVKAVAAIRGQ